MSSIMSKLILRQCSALIGSNYEVTITGQQPVHCTAAIQTFKLSTKSTSRVPAQHKVASCNVVTNSFILILNVILVD